jgi:hypothetical protein
MKSFLIISIFFLFSFKLNDKKVGIEIEGNPSCIESGKVYKMKINFAEGTFYENLVIRGKGVQIAKDYTIKASDIFNEVSIIVSYKDSTSKVIDIDTFVINVCSDTLKNNN